MTEQTRKKPRISFPLSLSQQSIWLHQKMNPTSNAYNIPVFFSVDNAASQAMIENAIRFVIKKYDILSVHFLEIDGNPCQTINNLDTFPIEVLNEDQNLNVVLKDFVNKIFNIEEPPLFRFAICNTLKKEKFVLMVFHHLISDGTSLYLMAQEIRQAISYLKIGEVPSEKVSSISYSEFVELENEQLKTDEIHIHKKYWLEKLHGHLTYLSLPYDFVFDKQNKKGASKRLLIDDRLRLQLEDCAEKSKSSLYTILLSSFLILLHRLTGERDIIIGSPIITRNSKLTSGSQGLFLNTTMLRNHINPATNIDQFIKKVQSNLFQAIRHRAYPFSSIVKDLKIKSEANRFPISNIFFNGLTFFDEVLKEEAFEAFSDDFGLDMNFDLDCYVTYSKEKLMVRLDYREALFKEETIGLFLQKYSNILEQICLKYDQPIHTINYHTATAPPKAFGDAPWYTPDTSIVEVFYQQAEKYAQHIAVKGAGYAISYQQLNEVSNQWAHYLLDIPTETHVAICVSHNQNMAIAVLAALKAGKTYVPLDIAYPDTRKALLLKDAHATLVMTDNLTSKALSDLKGVTLVNLENSSLSAALSKQNLSPITTPFSAAYLMYTSGSTGKPKGVVQLHKNVLHFISQYSSALHIDSNDVVTGFSPITYDSFNNDFFGAMLNGATYCPLSLKDEVLDLGKWISQHEITIWHSVPSVFRMYAQEWIVTDRRFRSVRIIKMTGELVRLDDFESFKKITHKKAKFVVSLGSTEGTLSCINLFGHNDMYTRQIMPVGWPIERTQVLIVDDSLEELDVLEPGEILVASSFITPGYENDPSLNQAVFFHKEGKRFYRTGDLGRRLPDGKIEWIARKDDQLKINGIRIEPGEIESYLLSFHGIKEALVVRKDSAHGQKCLCAYYTADKDVADKELIDFLSNYIPQAIIPTYFIRLEKFTYNLHGKLDRKALPEPIPHRKKEFVAPRNDTEKKLCHIFAEVLGMEYNNISVEDSFFELGGHSLKVIQLIHRLHKTFNKKCELRDVFNYPTIVALAEMVKVQNKNIFEHIIPLPKREYYELSHAQQRLWILSKLSDASVAYHISNAIEIKGAFDIIVFQKAMIALIERHEALRTVFIEIDSKPAQKILQAEDIDFKIEYKDLSNISDKKEKTNELVNQESIKLFDYSKAPLMRALLIKLNNEKHILLLTLHHIISDGWTMEVLINEIRLLYETFKKDDFHCLPALNIQYKDYAAWHNQLLKSDIVKEHREYWLKQFEGEVPVLDMATDKPRPAIQTYNGNQLSFEIPAELTNKLKEFSHRQDVTLYMTLLAVIKTLLFRYTGQSDMVIGTATAGRDHIDLERQIGFYVNTLALRTQFNEDDAFEQLLKKVKEVTLGAFEHGLYTLDYLVDDLNIKRDLSRSPLFDVMVVLQNMRTRTGYIDGFEGLELCPFTLKHTISKFDFTFNFVEVGNIIRVDVEFNTDIYACERVEHLIDHLLSITNIVLNNPRLKINSFNYLSEKEKIQILEEFNNTETSYLKEKTIIQLFEEQVQKTPNNIALIYNNNLLSYKEFNEKTNQLAWLLSKKGIQPNDIISILFERSFEMMIAIIGIIKAGGAYLPIAPNYPKERINYIIENSNSKLLIKQENLLNGSKNSCETINLDEINLTHESIKNFPSITYTNHLAYVIYTSGSTGKPKGAMIEHHSLLNIIQTLQNRYPLGPKDVYLLKTAYVFDVSISEIFGWFIAGGALSILEQNAEMEPEKILEVIHRTGVTHLNFVPSMFSVFVEGINEENIFKLKALRYIFLAGEALPPELMRKFNSLKTDITIENLYGPTEATVYASGYSLRDWDENSTLPIGRPLDNIKLYITDKNNNLLPIGIRGELCIGGEGVARGYLNNREQTEEKFIKVSFAAGDRLYKTGDLARWLPDGNIEFFGRVDHQVKIRGFRIELGEIESQLNKHDKIKESVVITYREGSDKYICAYYVAENEINQSQLREFLIKDLPEYMIPAFYVKLSKFPLTPTGKIDRKSLPEPEYTKSQEYIAPSNENEIKLVELWKEVLRIDKVGVNDNFFELGGNSLKIIQLNSILKKRFNKNIPIVNLFRYPTISNFSKYLNSLEQDISFDDKKAVNIEKIKKGQERLKQRLNNKIKSY